MTKNKNKLNSVGFMKSDDRKIPMEFISLFLAILLQTGALFYWGGRVETRQANLEKSDNSQTSSIQTLQEENKNLATKDDLKTLKNELTAEISRQRDINDYRDNDRWTKTDQGKFEQLVTSRFNEMDSNLKLLLVKSSSLDTEVRRNTDDVHNLNRKVDSLETSIYNAKRK